MYNKYVINSPDFNGRRTITDLLGNDVAMLDNNDYLSFSSDTNKIIREEIKEFLKHRDIAFF